MGVKASRLLLIDMLKGMCGGGLDVPLTEHNIFDENGEILDEKFDEYLMQQDDVDEGKKRVFLALASMVGQRMKGKKEDLLGDSSKQANEDYTSEVVYGPRHWSAPPKDFKNECSVGGRH